ncbi:hypothetical protein [Actinacidiphila sp. bgisy160]|uniref:hypothetical protein n=1 Tax=Actinacidiphila sp. bgisy160 TaxID=3413796 RepID=UPI003D7497DF
MTAVPAAEHTRRLVGRRRGRGQVLTSGGSPYPVRGRLYVGAGNGAAEGVAEAAGEG